MLLIGAMDLHAQELMESIKTELETNELLAADFPEAIYPILRLERIANNAKGQLHLGQPTYIHWGRRKIVFPTTPGRPASGAILECAGLLGRLRGKKHKRPDGSAIRPDLAVIEDPQSDASARSPDQCAKRRNIVNGAVLKLSGPDRRIAAVMPATVIQPGDMIDQLLDTDLHPHWQGRRFPFFYSEPTDEKRWTDYADILRRPARYEDNLAAATAYYREHRAEMDAGAKVAWEHRYEPGEISAVQHGMDVKILDAASYYSEYQNDPKVDMQSEGEFCPADVIVTKLAGRRRGVVPEWATILSMMVDVHDKLLYWAVGAFDPHFHGAVIDYGTYPDQRRRYFTLREAGPTLKDKCPGAGLDAAIHAGLLALFEQQLGREWACEDGTAMRIKICLVDEGYKYRVVHAAIRASPFAGLLYPSKGISVRAGNKPMAEYHRKEGDRDGDHWRIPKPKTRRQLRSVWIDTNYWKSQLHAGLGAGLGDQRTIELFTTETSGGRRADHQMLADHIAKAERYTITRGYGRTVQEWNELPNRPDNHGLDVCTGMMVGASIEGAVIPGTLIPTRRPRRRRRVRYHDS